MTHRAGSEHGADAWIDCVVDMFEMGPDSDYGYLTAHCVFQTKVLGRSHDDALRMAVRARNVALDRARIEQIARDWMKCSACSALVAHSEDDLCPACQEAVPSVA
jgi:hypothetical protein